MLSVGNTAFLCDAPMTVQEYMTGLGFAFITGGVINGVAAEAKDLKFSNGGLKEPQAQTGISGTPASASPAKQAPQAKGKEGVRMAKEQLKKEGYDVIGEEVSYSVEGGVNGRIDLVVEKSGDLVPTFVEVKNGPSATFTPNQKINYPLIEGGARVTPFGDNAVRFGINPNEAFKPAIKYMQF